MKLRLWPFMFSLRFPVCLCVLLLLVAACHGNNMQYPQSSKPVSGDESSVTKPVPESPQTSKQAELAGTVPAGIFVSSGPTVSDRVLGQPHVTGNLIRVGWDQLQPAPAAYDFSAIDKLIAQARQHNKRVTLSVLNGPRTPSWVYEQGAKAFSYEFKTRYSGRGNRQEIIPLPWDTTYLSYWRKLIAELGKRYADNPMVALVHITHASKNGFEMQLPEERIAGRPETPVSGPWHDAGYTQEKHVKAIQQVITYFAEAFPHTPLDIEIHPVLDSVEPARQVYEFGKARYGQRFGLFSAWWSGKSQRWNEALYPLLKSACEFSFCNIQMIGNQTRQPERLLNGSLLSAMREAEKLGARYFEVWSADLANHALQGEIVTFSSTLQQD
mgnify:CR=1 FL=1|tara:strand:+ start:10149 stop:11300 length:1152 start_codon:yes stop_codon:yes gene_type:complete